MTPQPEFLSKLSALPLRRLRELARVLGIPRYSAQARDGLLQAIASKSPAGESTPAALEQASSSQPVVAQAATSGFERALSSAVAATETVTTLQVHPQDAQWAYCRWEISAADRDAIQAAGGGSLCLRLADITGLAEGDAHPQAFLEAVVEGAGGEWYLPVPLAGRVYRAELGFRSQSGWISLAFSAPAAMPAEPGGGFEADLVRPFSLDVMPTDTGEFVMPAPAGVHERVYQVASLGRRRLGVGSEEFQESAGAADRAAAGQASGVGLWASGLSESGRGGVATRQRSFWLVADAELIVYGATEPSARLSIAGQDEPLSVDGTFRFQVPFPDGEQVYPIRAVAADGVQTRSITLDFKRTTPAALVNTREAAVPEWF
ncbi:MAG: DUF4912 domain-containing protein [Synechococcaceae cyanobacterium]|jgi:hypothetical protein